MEFAVRREDYIVWLIQKWTIILFNNSFNFLLIYLLNDVFRMLISNIFWGVPTPKFSFILTSIVSTKDESSFQNGLLLNNQ